MNKYLAVLSAAVLSTNSIGAAAGEHSFLFCTAGGGCYCDMGTVKTAIGGNKAVRAWVHFPACSNGLSQTSQGLGLLGKTKGLGSVSDMSDTFLAKYYGIFSEQLAYTLPKQIANGQPWTMWVGFDGVSSFEGNSGVLCEVRAGRPARGRGTRSTIDAVKALIGARKASAKQLHDPATAM